MSAEKNSLVASAERNAEPCSLKYVVITPARNEERYIEGALRSMIAQTVLPVKWVIVSDGSTDRTDEIVEQSARQHPWIELVKRPRQEGRSFASKAHAISEGHARLSKVEYDVIANLDADVSFEADYFEFLLAKFAQNSRLGMAGTTFKDPAFQYDYRFTSIDHVAGPCQLFRRECYESIGGYVPVKGGGIDVIAVLTAQMRGWETRTFPEKLYIHHREMGTAKAGSVMAKFKDGHKDYTLGSHPLWEVCRVTYQLTKKPFVIGGMALFAGYVWCCVRRVQRPISRELMEFRRRDQMRRLRAFGKRLFVWSSPPAEPIAPPKPRP